MRWVKPNLAHFQCSLRRSLHHHGSRWLHGAIGAKHPPEGLGGGQDLAPHTVAVGARTRVFGCIWKGIEISWDLMGYCQQDDMGLFKKGWFHNGPFVGAKVKDHPIWCTLFSGWSLSSHQSWDLMLQDSRRIRLKLTSALLKIIPLQPRDEKISCGDKPGL